MPDQVVNPLLSPNCADACAPGGEQKLLSGVPASSWTGLIASARRFCDKRWVPSRIPTVGVDFGSKRVHLGSGATQCVHLDFFDLAGAQEYVAVREEVYADAQGTVLGQSVVVRCLQCVHLLSFLAAIAHAAGAVLVYDSSRLETFNSLGMWLSEAAENRATGMVNTSCISMLLLQ